MHPGQHFPNCPRRVSLLPTNACIAVEIGRNKALKHFRLVERHRFLGYFEKCSPGTSKLLSPSWCRPIHGLLAWHILNLYAHFNAPATKRCGWSNSRARCGGRQHFHQQVEPPTTAIPWRSSAPKTHLHLDLNLGSIPKVVLPP